MGRLDRWDQANQRRAEADNEALGGDDWAERLNGRLPGPSWAWKLEAVPGIGWIGTLAIVFSSIFRRRRTDSGS